MVSGREKNSILCLLAILALTVAVWLNSSPRLRPILSVVSVEPHGPIERQLPLTVQDTASRTYRIRFNAVLPTPNDVEVILSVDDCIEALAIGGKSVKHPRIPYC